MVPPESSKRLQAQQWREKEWPKELAAHRAKMDAIAAEQHAAEIAEKEARAKEIEDFIASQPQITEAQKEAIRKQQIQLGMNLEMVRHAWGDPQRKSESVYAFGKHETWIYGDTYLFFEKGILKSWHRTNAP